MFDETGAFTGEFGKTLPAMSKLRESALPAHETWVLWALMSRASPKPEGWQTHCSFGTLALDARISRRAAIDAVRDIEARGLIQRLSGNTRYCNTYIIDYLAIMELPRDPRRPPPRR